ncbi:MAG: glycosyltransferase [Actinobacteria bacterium]|nr:glycosyltransferase [Actinomycetota bacterium]
MLVSIIIPIYNSQEHLARCLDRLQNQSYKRIEVIMVDDGSTDKSSIICANYMRGDKRFRLIQKTNGGVSSARNIGIEKANGAYIGFVDSDDYVERNMIQNLVELQKRYNSPDILIYNCYKEDLNGKSRIRPLRSEVSVLTPEVTLNLILKREYFQGYVCNKLFKADLLQQDNKILFDEQIHVCEDLLFCCQCILASKNIVYDATPYYHYVFHSNNNSIKFNYKKLTALDAYEKIIELLVLNDKSGVNEFKNSFIRINISFLIQSIKEEKNLKTLRTLRSNLYRYRLSELTEVSVQVSCFLARLSPHLIYYLWRILKRNRDI